MSAEALSGSEPVVVFRDVVKQYGPVTALDGVSFEIRRGEMVALLGPNGAGKTTAIEIMLGLRRSSAGDVRVLSDSPRHAVNSGLVGAMLQRGALPENARVVEVVELVRVLYGGLRTLDELLTMAQLTELARRRVDKLSGGEAQRVRLALCMAGRPELVFLDEPTVSLDVELRRSFWGTVRNVAAEGTSVLFATHYLDEADENADRVLVLHRGRVVADGPPSVVKGAAGHRTVTCVLSDPDPAALQALPGVAEVTVHGDKVELRCTDADIAVAALYETGRQISDLRVADVDLEDALINLTR